jgi:hypothetical protein
LVHTSLARRAPNAYIRPEREAGNEMTPTSLQKVAYVALLLLMLAVAAGMTGGL